MKAVIFFEPLIISHHNYVIMICGIKFFMASMYSGRNVKNLRRVYHRGEQSKLLHDQKKSQSASKFI